MQEQAIIKSSISKQIAEQLRNAIVSGRFKSGERLPTEDELATRYGVSRATVREALKRLAAQNLVRSRRGPAGGNFVNQPTHAELAESLSGAATLLVGLGALDIEEIVEARRTLQGGCLKLAVVNASQEQIQDVETALQLQKDPALSDEAFCDADVAFHRGLVDASNNGMVRFVMYSIIEALVPITNMVVSYVKDRREIIAFHEGLLLALQQRNEQGLESALDALLDYLMERFSVAQAQRKQHAS
ncbi:MAG: GntR family transcriptional regulator [Candidatus Thiodiazotropha sp. (ex Ustalcina ferruginea)]|nr:GntR family transcriptional regulator [Candidatus Thiodiazotropha sp. (ex Ustalcina ferruginea)]